MRTLTIATRGSKLALWQAEHIKARILQACPELCGVELLVLKTKGDIIQDVPLAKVGGKGLFVKEIEEALLDGRAHLAVHSMKDVPMRLPEGLVLGAIPEREDAADALLCVNWPDLASLPSGALVGTSSLRRQAQLLALRPDLTIRSLRGNVDTRLRKLMDGEFDAIVMAAAGLKRLGLTAPHCTPLPVDICIPAAGQGALGIEFAAANTELAQMLAFLDHPPTRICVEAERGLLFGLDGGCQAPIAAHAVMTGPESFSLTALVMDCEGRRAIRRTRNGTAATARDCGLALAEEIYASGGAALLAELYAASGCPVS